MIRTPFIAVMTVALLGSAAVAAPAGAPPTPLSKNAQQAPPDSGPGSDRDDGDDADYAPPPGPPPGNAPTAQQMAQQRDMFCRRDAAAHTGYTTPDEAARNEQARGSIGGALGGAALGAIIGGSGRHGNAGSGAAIGAGAGLLAGTAVGAANANRAAADVEHAYSDAYYACMNEAGDAPPPRYASDAPPPGYGYGYPPPYYAYGPYPYAPYGYGYGYPYYGSSLYFGFGGRGYGGYRGGFHGGGRGGFHHR